MTQRDYASIAREYAEQVVSGEIAACAWVRLACQRQLDDLARQGDGFEYYFDEDAAARICKFGERLIHVKGQWANTQIVLEPWQIFILTTAFGWKRVSDGARRYREMYCEIPRKNGKSVLGAVIGLYMLAADGESGAEVYSGATTEKQAWEVFRPARVMTMRTPGMKDHFGIGVNAKNLHILRDGSRFEPLIGNPGDGASPHCAIVDEYHEHKASDQYDTMITGMGARTQPMLVVITTAGADLSGPCYGKRDQVIKVLNGIIENDELFGIVYSTDEDDDWTDFNNWKKANPNFGVSVFTDYLKGRLRDAMQSPSRQNINRCKHLNQWMRSNDPWLNILDWQKCSDPTISIEQFAGEPCWIGLDLATRVDIAALVALFVKDGTVYQFNRFYLPEDTIHDGGNSSYVGWHKEGWLVSTPGNVTDYGYIKDDLKNLLGSHQINQVAYDPYQATQLATELMDDGFPMVEIRPNVLNFSEPMKDMEARVMEGRWRHNGDPVQTWMISNVVCHYDNKDNVYPRKERNENKIDGPVAAIMALGAYMREEDVTSVYERREMVVL